jgi:glucose/arabinose dehydrogenase
MLSRLLGCLVVALAAAACGSEDSRAVATPAPAAATATPRASADAAATATATAAQARRGVRLSSIGRFDQPVYVTSPPGDTRRLFVVEQTGAIRVVRGGQVLRTPFLNLESKVSCCGERGLLSLAFAPDYAQSGRFYVYYTDRSGDTQVIEYRRRSADRADAGSARRVLSQAQPEPNHNGGLLLFGPDDLLYIGLGDGGGGGDRHGQRGNAQDLGTWLGKLLRIDPRAAGGRAYSVPQSNPFVGRSSARPEIYAYGLRNPWRFSFDRETGDLSIGDVGQNAVEEISFVRRGRGRRANFGWRPWEGTSRLYPDEAAPGHVRPVITRSHGAGWCSITGGVVVRDRALAGLYGRYVFGDFCRGEVISARLRVPRARDVRETGLRVDSLSSFGEDASGRVYALSLEGPVYRLVAR